MFMLLCLQGGEKNVVDWWFIIFVAVYRCLGSFVISKSLSLLIKEGNNDL